MINKFKFSIFLIMLSAQGYAQELFVYTEPASNMAAKSIGLRLNNFLMHDASANTSYMLAPELMWGVSKKIMLHGESFFSSQQGSFDYVASSLYLKYRFFSQDEVHSHFRMAAYGKAAKSNMEVTQPGIDFGGRNTGFESGLVATKLVNKWAFSAGVSHLFASDNAAAKSYNYSGRNAIGYNLSIGKLTLPKEYISYDQLNMNLMLEILGQTHLSGYGSYLDLAPSVQFIIKSKMRVDAGYRFAVNNNLGRIYNNSFLLRFEYNFFNVYK